ncbi:hemolysin family protein [Gordonia amicalis]|uniref:hemolysin family protein n=1 Tax=Gordonia amicalis TaxID=89053 RepID=UPI0002A64245|nr:hemolysin family protein [Gordonia amicalis]MBA5847879.1 HlyC/CorC family transporter [Gordonia amicalis]MDJ0453467.1 hemolysin family protein [Gordonia amicalis]MDV7076632.1 hemolysin family protein [Gordonia amicalis]MDV7099900.1 hemolysin family protein [Gordonia amicalis]MDV7174282.1 hemolysin family protein [Gordonia amicalis]
MEVLLLVASLVGFIALTLGTALFVAAEFSLTALERSTISADVAKRGDRRSRLVQRAHSTLSFQLSGAQLGITITTLITGYIAEPVLARIFKPPLAAAGVSESVASATSLILALVIATSLSMVLGELIPKNLAIAKSLAVARATSGPMTAFSAVFRWAINGLNGTANWVVRRLGVEPTDELASARSPQELVSLVRNSARRGALDEQTATLVDRSLRFGELTAEDLMTPRVTIDTLDRDDTVRDLVMASSRTGHSRFPVVVDGDLDDLVGVVHIKQAFTVPPERQATTRVTSIARTVPRVPASLDGDALMERIRADGMELCVVIDEYGGTAGIVTTEDLIEEILGDVTDEHDYERADVVPIDGNGYLCAGLLRIDELYDATGYHAPDGPYDTLGGLIMYCLGRIPTVDDVVDLPRRSPVGDGDGSPEMPEARDDVTWRATVAQMDGRRIDVVALRPAPPAERIGDEPRHPEEADG